MARASACGFSFQQGRNPASGSMPPRAALFITLSIWCKLFRSCTEAIMNRVAAILPAAGLGTRMGADTPKQFLSLDGIPLLLFTLRRLAACPEISDFVIATRGEEIDSVSASVAAENLGRPVSVVRGGDSRQDSVANALAEFPPRL